MTQSIEQLTARVRELEEENARLRFALADTEALELGTSERLVASQAYAEQLREALEGLKPLAAYGKVGTRDVEQAEFQRRLEVLTAPRDTSALDAYVAERVTRPNFSQMREMLRAMQAGELTVSRGIEILHIWHAGNWNDDMLPPVRQDLIEEDSMPVEIIDRLTRQRDLAVEALNKIKYSDAIVAAGIAQEALSAIRESEVKE